MARALRETVNIICKNYEARPVLSRGPGPPPARALREGAGWCRAGRAARPEPPPQDGLAGRRESNAVLPGL
jgi:hypothetical protein